MNFKTLTPKHYCDRTFASVLKLCYSQAKLRETTFDDMLYTTLTSTFNKSHPFTSRQQVQFYLTVNKHVG